MYYLGSTLDGWQRRCPCGANATTNYGQCRKCRARTRYAINRARRFGRFFRTGR